MNNTQTRFDFLVIGSGLAGLTSALELSKHGRVLVASKVDASECNSFYAQGGIACVVDADDTVEAHIQDTLGTGNGLGNPDVVRQIVQGGFERIAELEKLGVLFDQRKHKGKENEYDLGQEGGHSLRRVLHAGDITGQSVMQVLIVRARANPNITVRENLMAVDLVTTEWIGHSRGNRCVGAYFLDKKSNEIFPIHAACTVLATGGLGKVYPYTSNPDVATGDGVAMAWRAGLPVRNMEFVQFHPTCLYHSQAKSFLISEAVRGEGAELKDIRGNTFMADFDERGSLAPRDVTARAIDFVMKKHGDPYVYLDITHRSESFLRERFPNLYATCLRYGINMAKNPIPVVPAAHYSCGGVVAEVNGTTALPGLYACGEVASTGLHGANRLASNSLLEALVCGHETALEISSVWKQFNEAVAIPGWKCGEAVSSDEAVVVEHNWNEVRTAMWDYVGIVRTDRRLARARARIRNLRQEIKQYYGDYLVTSDLLELRNIADVAELVIRSAEQREESRGLHYMADHPEPDSNPVNTLIHDQPGGPLT
ncbi:L-aspartate oxidase [Pontiella sulfatireligans]|uniref:L-aspartate oxidase n=1 Tax=Pontiella sulfatireligans TaxID=2750658 RepID=A0A6C2UMQ9_9BACT|nr:L-aspartate oxidase [Pontiella sulfatireligans]VGO21572.1 L-aspartate oxidase [Pontiella sulfatireligans]